MPPFGLRIIRWKRAQCPVARWRSRYLLMLVVTSAAQGDPPEGRITAIFYQALRLRSPDKVLGAFRIDPEGLSTLRPIGGLGLRRCRAGGAHTGIVKLQQSDFQLRTARPHGLIAMAASQSCNGTADGAATRHVVQLLWWRD